MAPAALGMNEEELARNSVATDFVVHDLNVDPRLPYEDNSFDVVTNAVSVDCALLAVAVCSPVWLATSAGACRPRVSQYGMLECTKIILYASVSVSHGDM